MAPNTAVVPTSRQLKLLTEEARKEHIQAVIWPVREEVERRQKTLGKGWKTIEAELGMDAHRLMKVRYVNQSPSWVEFNQLLIAVGMTPDEAAHIAGLYETPGAVGRSQEEQRLVSLFSSELLNEDDRRIVLRLLEKMVIAAQREPEYEKANAPQRQPRPSRRKKHAEE